MPKQLKVEIMKLSKRDKEYLLSIGYVEDDISQIEKIAGYTICIDELLCKRISKKLARQIIGSERFLSALARSCFHYTSVTNDGGRIAFDSSRWYKV